MSGVGSLGLVLPTFPQCRSEAAQWEDLAAVAAAAEAHVSSLWICDHLYWHGPCLDVAVAATVAASATKYVTVGTATVQLPLRQPVAVAKMAASLQSLSGGRFILGVGVGQHADEYAAAGSDFHDRGARCDIGIDRLRSAWRGEGVGDYAQLPRPQPIPIWVGGRSARARRRAALLGQGWMPIFLDAGEFRRARADIIERLLEAGRCVDTFTFAAMIFVSVGSRADRDAGLEWLSALYRLPKHRFERHLIAGSGAVCADAVHEFQDAGADHVALFVTDDDPLDQAAHIADACGLATPRTAS